MLLCLSGCSSTTFLYNRLDTLIGWYVLDYVSLSRDQRNDFDRRVDALLDWHRAEELPAYVVWLTEFEESLDEGLTEVELDKLVDQLVDSASFENGTVSTIDGVRVDFDYGFGLLRASNTTPTVIMRFEADSDENIRNIQQAFRELFASVNPKLELPF